jgi:hypothetical protein
MQLEALMAIPHQDLPKKWETERKRIPATWGIDFSPTEEESDEEDDVTVEEKKKEEVDLEDDDFDEDEELPSGLRKKILLAGSGPEMEIKKSFPAHLDSNFSSKSTPKFSGQDPKVTISRVWLYLQKIHLASNISYADRIEAVLFCLTGEAEDRNEGYQNKVHRIDYLNLWRDLFLMYGDVSAEIARQDNILRNSTPKSTNIKDIGRYISKIKNALQALATHGEDTPEKYIMAWESIYMYAKGWFEKFAITRDKSYYKEHKQNIRSYYKDKPKQKLERFYNFIYRSENESKTEQENVAYGIFNTKAQAVPEERKRSREEDHHEKEPPAKRQNRDNTCFMCDEDHHWSSCKKSMKEKMELFRKKNLCQRCGRKGHDKFTCPSTGRCHHCFNPRNKREGDHHTAICFKKYGAPTPEEGKIYRPRDSRRGRSPERNEEQYRNRNSAPEKYRRDDNRRRSRSPIRGRRSPARDNYPRERRRERTPARKDQKDDENEKLRKQIAELEKRLKDSASEEKKTV